MIHKIKPLLNPKYWLILIVPKPHNNSLRSNTKYSPSHTNVIYDNTYFPGIVSKKGAEILEYSMTEKITLID